MPVVLIDGIVTRYTNYRENDRIISIFTIERGRVDAKARGCRKTTSALLPACQPFVYGQFELFYNKDKYTVNQCQIKETFYPLREDYARFAYGCAMLQLVNSAVQENEPNEPLFSLLYHALSFLAYGQGAPRELFSCFLIRYLDKIGYRPAITACARCGRALHGDEQLFFSTEAGGAVCAACAFGAKRIAKLALEAMRRMLLLPDAEMDRARLPDALGSEVLHALADYAAHTLDYGARAFDVLKAELFAACADTEPEGSKPTEKEM